MSDYFDFNLELFAESNGYTNHWETLDDTQRSDVIAKIQIDYGFDPDGKFSESMIPVLKMLKRRQCSANHENFANVLNAWGKSELLLYVESAPVTPSMTKSDFIDAIGLAMEDVGKVCGLSMKLTNNPRQADIVSGVGRGRRAGFDGPSGILAWCEIPPSGDFQGKIRMMWDMEENWTPVWDARKAGRSIMVPTVFLHEVGHGLGLMHDSDQRSRALMDAMYDPAVRTFLRPDIARLQKRYGLPKQAPSPAGVPASGPTTPPVEAAGSKGMVISHLLAVMEDGTRQKFFPRG